MSIDQKVYNQFIKDIELEDIQLIKAEAFTEATLFNPENAKPVIAIKSLYDIQNNEVAYTITNTFKVTEDKKLMLKVSCKYIARYSLKNVYDEDYFHIFGEKSASLSVWGFFREYVNSMVVQMGYPRLILPLIKR